MARPPEKTITLRVAGGGARQVGLYGADFALLRRINAEQLEVRHIEREFRRLQGRRLVTHKFVAGTDGFPRAIAVLTADGEQAITLEHAPA